MNESRYIVGIDLGTTNIAVFYVDTQTPRKSVRQFPLSQVVAPGEVQEERMLPSFAYLLAPHEKAENVYGLPWQPQPSMTIGRHAQTHGASVPNRLIHSAKSWLAHAGVDRTEEILPWGSELSEKHSPLAITTRYIDYVRRAWNHKFGANKDADGTACRLEEQQVTITIPASFDEVARDLTLRAAVDAGLNQVTLLEEPLAAFYAWLRKRETDWQSHVAAHEKVLVIDVGGGTTDFSIIEMDEQKALRRFAVGEHLLLGGDNIDMAIGRHIEGQWKTKLPAAEWSSLCQLCRGAKEKLLESRQKSVDITLLSQGSSVVGNTRTATLTEDVLLKIMLEGFFPLLPAEQPAPRRQGGMRQMGLPYASDPAITVHLLHFLKYANHVTTGGDANVAPAALPPLFPDKIVFNGGTMIPKKVRQRVIEAIHTWFPDRSHPVEISGTDFSLAVAAGAAYYGKVRRGDGVHVHGGLARAYYLEVETKDDDSIVCLIARDTEENVAVTVPGNFRLRANAKVQFSLFSSATRLHDQPGDRLAPSDELSVVAPLVSVLQFGKVDARDVDVELACSLSEIGTIDAQLKSLASSHVWPLRFDLRPVADAPEDIEPAVVFDAATNARATACVRDAFVGGAGKLRSLMADLEAILETERERWTIPILRLLADELLELADSRSVSPAHESRWLNLMGFCMRPGFGDAADSIRIRKCWQLWFQGVHHQRQPQVLADWWVFWRRVAPGLKDGHQNTIAAALQKVLVPKGVYRNRIREGTQAQREMWRCVGALEQISVKSKRRLGDILVNRLEQLDSAEYWVLARLGARRLFHAPAERVLPSGDAMRYVDALLGHSPKAETSAMHLFAITRIASHSGDRAVDLDASLVERVKTYLENRDCNPLWVASLEPQHVDSDEDMTRVLGDSLPLGLTLSS